MGGGYAGKRGGKPSVVSFSLFLVSETCRLLGRLLLLQRFLLHPLSSPDILLPNAFLPFLPLPFLKCRPSV